MGKYLLILLSFSLLSVASANEDKSLFCVMTKGRAVYEKIKQLRVSDKVKHCALSCTVTLKCGAESTFKLGLIKELVDLFGPGNAEIADIVANIRGIRLAIFNRASSDKECLTTCKNYYLNYRQ